MFVNKIGYYHTENGLNCQDFGFNVINPLDNTHFKLVCDGCSDAKISEVGSILFTAKLEEYKYEKFNTQYDYSFEYIVNKIFINMLECYPFNNYINIHDEDMAFKLINMYAFTVLSVIEDSDSFEVNFCGDGYIILQDNNDNISFKKIDNGNYPKYYIYNFIRPQFLIAYKDGVKFESKIYNKNKYKRIGIASDGIRFVLDSNDENLINEFKTILLNDKEVVMKRFINKNQKLFKDDVTISW